MSSQKAPDKRPKMSPWLWHIETRGVITPSDFLSEEEKSQLSGPVITYTLPKSAKEEPVPMEKQDLQSRPNLTRETMEALIKEGRSTSQLAKMFGVSRGTINNKKRQWGLVRPLSLLRTQAEQAQRPAAQAPAPSLAVAPVPAPRPEPEKPEAERPEPRRAGHFQINVNEVLEAAGSEQLLKNIANFVMANGGTYEICLTVQKVK